MLTAMQQDSDALWERAWLARDPAYDGRFFIGVRTTGVYCRCVCPVRLPLRRNIEFLPSASAAEAAGFSSLRRFNAVFAQTYQRPPRDMRRPRPKLRG